MTPVAGERRIDCLAGDGPGDLAWFARRCPTGVLDAARGGAYGSGRVLERDGERLFALGTAVRLDLVEGLADGGGAAGLVDLLGRLEADATSRAAAPGGPVALGALPFDPTAAGHLVLPHLLLHERSGEEPVAIAVGSPAELDAARAAFPFSKAAPPPAAPPREEAPDHFELVSERSHADFRARVAAATEAIGRGELDKVVLAREVVVKANRPFAQADLLERVRRLHPSCLAYGLDGFVGASPELLCRRRGGEVLSQPLAGTVARSGDPDEDARLATALLASSKERSEHRFVVDAIVSALGPLVRTIRTDPTPHLLELRNVAHLATTIRAELDPAVAPSALGLVAALHPTPAVGGAPTDAALEYLAKHEELERDRYAGPLGWVDAAGDGEFWLGLRCALLAGRTARLFAGVGIVAGSEPAEELVETQLKLQALLAAAVRP